MTENYETHTTESSTQSAVLQWVAVALLVYLLISAVELIGGGFKAATADHAKELFGFAENPFAGLVVGMLATALIQSSSTVTSIIVGLVAGGLPVTIAVPMVMGANIGTSITNTIVSLGHIGKKSEFRRAFSAATVHDFFNLLLVGIFLPLEMAFGVLQRVGGLFASVFYGGESASIKSFNFVKTATKPFVGTVKDFVSGLGDPLMGVSLIILGVLIIFFSITTIGKLLKKLMVGRAKQLLHSAIGRGPMNGIASGAVVTFLVQSSSTTTSLMVPLAGSGAFKLRQIYPFTLGANIGTCVTAVLAATAVTGNGEAALQIAFIHLVYNVLGVLIIYGLPPLRFLPVKAAHWMGKTASENRMMALLYLVFVFFVLPGTCLLITSLI